MDMQPSQTLFDKRVRERPVPTNQDCNVDKEEQDKIRPVPSEKEAQLELECINIVTERFDLEKPSKTR